MLRLLLVSLAVFAGMLALALGFGGPRQPPPMASISDPFQRVDFSDLPPLSRWTARDGASLAYLAYAARGGVAKGSVVLVHGSSASSSSLHVLAKAMAAAGYSAYALDIRGHGASGTRGSIGYIGQLEDDMEDFVAAVQPARPATLAGFSSGGGFVLRFAGSARQHLFTDYLLLSPFINRKAPTFRPDAGGWIRVGVPRIIALNLLNTLGVRHFNDLPVVRFALSPAAMTSLTPAYSYALAQNFQPEQDYRANIRALGQPVRLLAGQADEVFHSDRFAEVFQAAGKAVPVTLLPGIGHIGLTLEPAAVQAAAAQVKIMDEP
jgi:alpha-beta hydrolase superfamily lysophospholipase